MNGKWCVLCKRLITDTRGCACTTCFHDGTNRKRIPVGDPRDTAPGATTNCRDCNAPPGTTHHFACEYENCPVCGQRLHDCGCRFIFVGKANRTTVYLRRGG